MRGVLENVRLFFVHAWFSYRALFTWLTPRHYLILKILNPVSQVLFFALLGQQVGRDPAYFVIGNAVHLATVSGIFGVLQVVSAERQMGTLPSLIITPASNAFIFFGRGVFMVLDGLTSIAAGFIVGSLVFRLNFSMIHWPWLILALLVTSFAVSALGLVLGVMALVGTDVNYVLNIALGLLLVVCGVNFPVEDLPTLIRWLAYGLPLTHGLMAVRAIFAGDLAPVLGLVLRESLVGGAYLLAGYGAFELFERHARRKGTLELH